MLLLLTAIFTMTLEPMNGEYNGHSLHSPLHMNFTNMSAMTGKLLDIHLLKTAD